MEFGFENCVGTLQFPIKTKRNISI